MRIRTLVSLLVVSSLLWNSSALAQQGHVVAPADMLQAIADQAVTDQQNRDTVLSVLHRSEASDLAGHLGLSLTRAEEALSTLDSAELERLAGTARMAEAQFVGGASTTIVISLTTLLLIIIIVLLIAK